MTQSFIDESTQGQGHQEAEQPATQSDQQVDLMTSSFMGDSIPVPDDQSYVQNGDASSFLGLSSQGQNDLLGEEVDGQTDLLGGDVGGLSGPVTPQQGGDPMTDSFIDMNTLNSNAARDPMTQSFIDESTSLDDCSTKSLVNSTPALTETDSQSAADGRSLNDFITESPGPATPASHVDPQHPLAPVAPATQQPGELISGWASHDCAGCKSPDQSHDQHTSSHDKSADQVSHDKSHDETPSSTAEQAVSAGGNEFDPLREWGEPQQLPLPPSPTPGDNANQASGDQKPAAASSKPAAEKKKTIAKANGAKASPKPKTTAAPSRIGAAKTSTPPADKKPAGTGAKRPTTAPTAKVSTGLTKKTTTESKRPSSAVDGPAKSSAAKPARPTSALTKPSTKPAASKPSAAKPSTAGAAKKPASGLAKPKTAKDEPAKPKALEKKAEAKPRATPPRSELKKPAGTKADDSKKPIAKSGLAKPKTAAAKSSQSSAGAKASPKSSAAVYVDLAYVPHHGESKFVDSEYFQLIHARYYVFSGLNPPAHAFNSLLSAKASWESDPVTIIPTYDTDILHQWLATNRDQLTKLNIDVAPAASRCFVQLAEGNSSFPAYRLEF